MGGRAAIILAAGKGTRMKSAKPKVLHEVAGLPMIDWSIALARAVGCDPIVVVVSPSQTELKDSVEAKLGSGAIAVQSEPLGTGHAVGAAKSALADHAGTVVVLYADTPLIQADTIEALLARTEEKSGVGVLGFEAEVPGAYGRLVTDGEALDRIVEAKDASADELAITFCNSGVMAAGRDDLFSLLGDVTNDNAKGEYYLTDIVGLAKARGLGAHALNCDEADVMGVNSRVELAAVEHAFQVRRRTQALEDGVTMIAPDTIFFSHDTLVETDVVLEPSVVFGAGVTVRSGATIRAFSHLDGAEVRRGAIVGPYARLRPGTLLEEGVRVGNFVELKNTHMHEGAKANHLAYLGDGDVGAGANIGAGTIFCNYDGFFKYRTTIGDGAFVGSNSSLVAPVAIGDGAYIGSGSVITKDVPADALAIAREQSVEKNGWALSFRTRMQAKKADGGTS